MRTQKSVSTTHTYSCEFFWPDPETSPHRASTQGTCRLPLMYRLCLNMKVSCIHCMPACFSMQKQQSELHDIWVSGIWASCWNMVSQVVPGAMNSACLPATVQALFGKGKDGQFGTPRHPNPLVLGRLVVAFLRGKHLASSAPTLGLSWQMWNV